MTVGIAHHREMPGLQVGAARRAAGDPQAVVDHLLGYVPVGEVTHAASANQVVAQLEPSGRASRIAADRSGSRVGESASVALRSRGVTSLGQNEDAAPPPRPARISSSSSSERPRPSRRICSSRRARIRSRRIITALIVHGAEDGPEPFLDFGSPRARAVVSNSLLRAAIRTRSGRSTPRLRVNERVWSISQMSEARRYPEDVLRVAVEVVDDGVEDAGMSCIWRQKVGVGGIRLCPCSRQPKRFDSVLDPQRHRAAVALPPCAPRPAARSRGRSAWRTRRRRPAPCSCRGSSGHPRAVGESQRTDVASRCVSWMVVEDGVGTATPPFSRLQLDGAALALADRLFAGRSDASRASG